MIPFQIYTKKTWSTDVLLLINEKTWHFSSVEKRNYFHENSWQKMEMVAENKVMNIVQKCDMTKENCAIKKKFGKSLGWIKRYLTKTTKNKGFFK